MPDQPEQRPKEVCGITAADFQHWKHHPVSRVVLKFLLDTRENQLALAQALWLDGTLTLEAQHEKRHTANTLQEIAGVSFEAIANFYDQMNAAKQEQEDADAEPDGS